MVLCPFFWTLGGPQQGPVCFAPSPTWNSSQFRLSATIDNQPSALPTARGQQQERASKGGKGSHREDGEQVLTRVLQSAACNPQKERETSVGHRPTVLELSPSKGNVSHGDTHQPAPLHSERGLGHLLGSVPSRPDPPIVEQVPSFPIPGRGVTVSCSAFRLVSEPKGVHAGGGCDDGSCLIAGLADAPLS